MSAARIGKIRLKSGGAEIRVLENGRPNLDGSNWRGDIMRSARSTAEHACDADLVGYLVVGIFSDGATLTSYAYDKARSPIPRALLPSWIAEVIRRDMITEVEAEAAACRVVNRANGFEED